MYIIDSQPCLPFKLPCICVKTNAQRSLFFKSLPGNSDAQLRLTVTPLGLTAEHDGKCSSYKQLT